MSGQIYPTELQLNKANSSDTEAWFFDLNLSITNDIVSSKIYDKRDEFNFEIVNFPFLDGDVPRSPSYGVYISQLISFARACFNVDDFNTTNLFLTAKLLKQGFFLSCISLFRIAFTHHNYDTYWNGIFNTAQQKFFTNIGQGHNLCKPKTFIT